MRKALIAGNWKMNGLTKDGESLAKEVAQFYSQNQSEKASMLVCPPFTLLSKVLDAVKGSGVSVGAQDCHTNESGAYTGDISAKMLKDLGCDYVILGHSERRTYHKESNELICAKAEAAIKEGLKAVICIGETEAERDAGKTINVCEEQFKKSVPAVSNGENTVIAYEPVWAIGTGKTPTNADVEEVHAAIRKFAVEKMGAEADKLQLLYGGSVKPSNAKELLSIANVDGALVGGASLKADDFIAIAKSRL
ncbi:MAG: triose-phosphate isomerase [Alphaproteobacteria bacterium]